MSSRNLFNIILKVIGILFIKNILNAITEIMALFLFYSTDSQYNPSIFIPILFSVAAISIYVITSFLLLFKTEKVIDKLKLSSDLPDELKLNIHRSTVISTIVIITGTLILINDIPTLLQELASLYQIYTPQIPIRNKVITSIILETSKIVIALLLLGNRRAIVNFIEYRSRNRKPKY